MTQKREFDVSDMEEHSNATVRGMVVEVSPIKASRKNRDVKYFSRKITDEDSFHNTCDYYSKMPPKSKRMKHCEVSLTQAR